MNETIFKTDGSRLTVTRTFNAPLELVWRAWTEAELLDQWWAPKPWKSETYSMEFKEGGFRKYAMVGPEGERHLCHTDYLKVNELNAFAGKDSFCDSDWNVNPEMPVSTFDNHFESKANGIQVTIISEYPSEEQLKMVLEMGMKEGLTMAFENLDQVLSAGQNA